MQTKQSEEPRALSLQEMEETNGGDAAAVICGATAGLIGHIWGSAAAACLAAGPAFWVGGAVALAVSGVIAAAAC